MYSILFTYPVINESFLKKTQLFNIDLNNLICLRERVTWFSVHPVYFNLPNYIFHPMTTDSIVSAFHTKKNKSCTTMRAVSFGGKYLNDLQYLF